MLLAAFTFASLMCSDNAPAPEVVEPISQVQEVIEPDPIPEPVVIDIPPQPVVPPPVVNEPEPVLPVKKYEDIMANLPPIVSAPPPAPSLIDVFMYDILHRPHVQRITEEGYRKQQFAAGDVLAYLWTSNTADWFLQYGVICTAYGDIYVTCNLDENGYVADLTKPLDVYYSSPSLRQIVTAVAHDNSHRFVTGNFSVDTIQNLDDLNFLFGDNTSQENSYNVAFLL